MSTVVMLGYFVLFPFAWAALVLRDWWETGTIWLASVWTLAGGWAAAMLFGRRIKD